MSKQDDSFKFKLSRVTGELSVRSPRLTAVSSSWASVAKAVSSSSAFKVAVRLFLGKVSTALQASQNVLIRVSLSLALKQNG